MRKRILSVLIAMSMTMAALPSFTAAAENNDGQEIFEQEIMQYSAEAEELSDGDGGIELMATADYKQLTVTAESAEIKQGELITFTPEQYEITGTQSFWSSEYSGDITFKNPDAFWVVKYHYIEFSRNLFETGSEENITFPIGADIPVGEYAVQIHLSNGACKIEADFMLTITANSDEGVELRMDDTELAYGKGFSMWIEYMEDGYERGTNANIYALTDTPNKVVHILNTRDLAFDYGIDPGNYTLEGYHEDFMSRFSKPKIVTVKSYKTKAVAQEGAIELYNGDFIYNSPFIQFDSSTEYAHFYYKLIDKESGEVYNSYNYVDLQLTGDGEYETEYTGVQITGVARLDPGEYEFYVLYNDTIYGPIDIKRFDYYLSDFYYTSLNKTFRPYYHIYDTESFAGNRKYTVDISIKDTHGKTVSDYTGLTPSHSNIWSDEYYFYTSKLPVPEVTENGAYILHTEFHFEDGTTKALDDCHIYIGEYNVVQEMRIVTHEHLTPATKEFGTLVSFGNYVSNPDDFSVSIMNDEGETIAESNNWYYYPNSSIMTEEGTYVMYITPLNNLSEGNYTVKLNNKSNNEIIGANKRDIRCEDSPIRIFNGGAKKVNDYTFTSYIDNVDAGVHAVYKNYHDTEAAGGLTVDKDGCATLIWNEAVEGSSISFYIDNPKEDDMSNRDYIYFDTWDNDDEPEGLTIDSVKPGFIPDGVASLEDVSFTLENKYPLFEEDIAVVQLISGGTVISEGTNVEYENYSTHTYNNTEYFTTTFNVDFPVIDASKLSGSATVRIVTNAGIVVYDLPVLADDEGDEYGSATSTSGVYYYDSDVSKICRKDNIAFSITGTNKTSGKVILQKYDADNNSYTNESELNLSELTKKGDAIYTYTGSFSAAEEGIYRLKFGSATTSRFRACDYDFYINTSNRKLTLTSSEQKTWLYTMNVNPETDTITAYYKDKSDNKVNIPLTIERYLKNTTNKDSYYLYTQFDFPDMEPFSSIDVYICVNETESPETMLVTDRRSAEAEVEGGFLSIDNNKTNLYVNGTGIDKADLTLKIWDFKDYKGKNVCVKTPVKEIKLNIPAASSEYYYYDLSALGLAAGKYTYVLFKDGTPLGYSSYNFYIGPAAAEAVSVLLNKKTVSDGTVTVNMENISNKNISNAKLIVAAYNAEGALLDVKSQSININAKAATGDINISSVQNAASYKVFLWDDIKTMKPLMLAE